MKGLENISQHFLLVKGRPSRKLIPVIRIISFFVKIQQFVRTKSRSEQIFKIDFNYGAINLLKFSVHKGKTMMCFPIVEDPADVKMKERRNIIHVRTSESSGKILSTSHIT